MKYFSLLIVALTSLAATRFLHRLRSRLPRWNVLSNAQKVALVSFISLTLMLPIITLATLEGTRLASKAVEPVTPPVTPTPYPRSFGDAVLLNRGFLEAQNTREFTNISSATLEAWIKPTKIDSFGSVILAKKFNPPQESMPYQFAINSDGKLRLFYATYLPASNRWGVDSAYSAASVTLDQWQHVAVTFGNGKIEFFINGIKVGSSNSSSQSLGYPDANAYGNELLIGASNSTDVGYFYGEMDDMRISDTVKYWADQHTIYPIPLDAFNDTYALWHFDTHSGNSTPDASNTAKHPAVYYDNTKFIPNDMGSTPTPTPRPELNIQPTITTTSLPPGILNRQYTATLTGYDSDETDILSLATSGLPAGLRQDKCTLSVVQGSVIITCTLTGRPLQAGIYPVSITLKDNRGGKITKVLPLRVIRRAEEAN